MSQQEGTWDMNIDLFLLILMLAMGLLFASRVEQKRNEADVKKISVRVNVNGIRGKSTATRFITAVLHEAGYKTMGKTTGTAAMKIFPHRGKEFPIKRKPQGANIKEQLEVIHEAAYQNMDALVCECMAVKPDYQNIYQNKMFHSNISVIVNVLEDHLEDMGPTLNEIALAFSQTIPYNGKLIIVPDGFTEFFTKIAEERNTEVFIVDTSTIRPNFIDTFDYVVFPDNIGLALSLAKALNIPEDVAYRGMSKATPDPGALKVKKIQLANGNSFTFVNAFAANEPASSLNIWEYIEGLDNINIIDPIVLFNGRSDRGDRTEQFAKDFFPKMPEMTLVGMGQSIRRIDYYHKKKIYPNVLTYKNFEDRPVEEIMSSILPIIDNRVLFAVGNIHGDGEELLEYIERISND